MEILGLGHSAFLVDMARRDGRGSFRVLGDPWLGDHVIGDLLGRWPRLRFPEGLSALAPLDAIWLSHSHTDHCDPESLVALYRELPTAPRLLLPQSLRFLDALLAEHLPGAERIYLEEGRPIELEGVTLEAFFNPERRGTNEDDVMVLVVSTDRETFLAEADALLPFYDPATQEQLAARLLGEDVETACFLTIKNEGNATMSMLSATSVEDRAARLGRVIESTYEEIWGIFCDPEDGSADLWNDPRVVRLVGGQGICYPQSLETDWNRTLFPIRLDQRVEMEREVAEQIGFSCSIEALHAGEWLQLDAGSVDSRRPHPGIKTLDTEAERVFDPKLARFDREFPCAPLDASTRDVDTQRGRILEIANGRFLPWLLGSRSPPLEHLLAAGGGVYRIQVRFGGASAHEDHELRIDFERLSFRWGAPSGPADEHYWANDLEDVLDGRADEFSTFSRRPLGAPAQRLWCSLGLPYLNNDLIERKLRLHFERARRGELTRDWVLGFYRNV